MSSNFSIDSTDDTDIIRSFCGSNLKDDKYKYSKIEYEINGKKIYIIKIVLNDEGDKPVLFALAGMSHKSFLGTSNIIISKLDDLATKFKEIYLLEYDSFTDDQKHAFKVQKKLIDDAGQENFEKMSIEDKLNGGFFEPVFETNNKIAQLTKDIINNLELSNIHLLGKCNGAGIVTILITNDPDKYKGLYLAVPGISSSVQNLEKIDSDKLDDINFVFGWTKQDAYNYIWGLKSFEEKDRYDNIMQRIIAKNNNIKYHSEMYDNNCQPHESDYHEIYPHMIDLIIETVNK
jgi:hypothetical protein